LLFAEKFFLTRKKITGTTTIMPLFRYLSTNDNGLSFLKMFHVKHFQKLKYPGRPSENGLEQGDREARD